MITLTIDQYMTPSPLCIGVDQTLAHAHEIMRAHDIRHLPVLDGGHLVGVLSLRDLHLVETLKGVDTKGIRVEDAMTPDPYSVGPKTSLLSVAARMAERKYGAAVVIQRGRVVGVFTTVDGMRALADLAGASVATPSRRATPRAAT
jgi:acetoin utilization protein AcuB